MGQTQTIGSVSVHSASGSVYRQAQTSATKENGGFTQLLRQHGDKDPQASAGVSGIQTSKNVDIFEIHGEMNAASVLRRMTASSDMSVFDDLDISGDTDDLDSSVAMDALDDIEDSLPSVSDYGFLDDSIDDIDDETTYISESIISAEDTDGYPEEEIDPGLGMNGDIDELDGLF